MLTITLLTMIQKCNARPAEEVICSWRVLAQTTQNASHNQLCTAVAYLAREQTYTFSLNARENYPEVWSGGQLGRRRG